VFCVVGAFCAVPFLIFKFRISLISIIPQTNLVYHIFLKKATFLIYNFLLKKYNFIAILFVLCYNLFKYDLKTKER